MEHSAPKIFVRNDLLVDHKENVDQVVHCAICNKEFRYKVALNLHMKQCSSSSGKSGMKRAAEEGPTTPTVIKKKVTHSSILGYLTPSRVNSSATNNQNSHSIVIVPKIPSPNSSTYSDIAAQDSSTEDSDQTFLSSGTEDKNTSSSSRIHTKDKTFLSKLRTLESSSANLTGTNIMFVDETRLSPTKNAPGLTSSNIKADETSASLKDIIEPYTSQTCSTQDVINPSPESQIMKEEERVGCPKCPQSFPSLDKLKFHLAMHYHQEIKAVNKEDFCVKCSTKFPGGILEHVAVKHPHLLKWLLGKEGLVVPELIKKPVLYYYFDVADFPLKRSQVNIKKIQTQRLDQCFLCQERVGEERDDALLHFLSGTDHYRLEMEREHCKPNSVWGMKKECCDCSERIEDKEIYIQHLAIKHKHLLNLIPEKYRLPPLVPGVFQVDPKDSKSDLTCPVPQCNTSRPDEMSLNVHIICNHIKKKLDAEFKKGARKGFLTCTLESCSNVYRADTAILKLNFYKHLLTHQEVKARYLSKI